MLIEAGRSTDGGRHLRFSKSDAAMMAPDVLILLNVRGTYWGFASARAPSCTDRRLPLAQARPVLEESRQMPFDARRSFELPATGGLLACFPSR